MGMLDKLFGKKQMTAYQCHEVVLSELGHKIPISGESDQLEEVTAVFSGGQLGGAVDWMISREVFRVSEFVPYVNEQLGFSFEYPMGWYKDFSGGKLFIRPSNAETVLVSGRTVLSPYITMLVREGIVENPSRFYKCFLSEQPANFVEYRLERKRPFKLPSGEEALEWSFEFSRGSYYFTAVSIIAAKRDNIFLLDGSCLNSQIGYLENTFRKVIRSLSLKSTAPLERDRVIIDKHRDEAAKRKTVEEHDRVIMDKYRENTKIMEYTKDHHLNKIEAINAREALGFLLQELEAKSSVTIKYFHGNIAVTKDEIKWLHIVAQPSNIVIIVYGFFSRNRLKPFTKNNLKEFEKISINARLESYGINLKVEKLSQIEDFLKVIEK